MRVLVLAVAGALLVAASVSLAVRGAGSLPLHCVLNETTGLHCPGCGMTRAAHAALNGDFGRALRFNPVGVVLLPLGLLALLPELGRWLTAAPPPLKRRNWGRLGTILAVVVIAFGILRNLPWKPFIWLAPPEGAASAVE